MSGHVISKGTEICTYLVVLFKGKMFGMTDFVNPKDHEEPVEQVLMKMTNGGVDHALECCGIPSCMVLTN